MTRISANIHDSGNTTILAYQSASSVKYPQTLYKGYCCWKVQRVSVTTFLSPQTHQSAQGKHASSVPGICYCVSDDLVSVG
jgi:hypothetical protein